MHEAALYQPTLWEAQVLVYYYLQSFHLLRSLFTFRQFQQPLWYLPELLHLPSPRRLRRVHRG
jgi:hypothetical protein